MSVNEENEALKPKGRVEVRVIGNRSAPGVWEEDLDEERRPNVVRLEPRSGKVVPEEPRWQGLETPEVAAADGGTGLDSESMRTIAVPGSASTESGRSGRRRRRGPAGRKPRKLSKRLVLGTWWMAATVTVLIVAGVITVVLTRPSDVPDPVPLSLSGAMSPEGLASEQENQRMLALADAAKVFLLDLAKLNADEAVERVVGTESVRQSFLREWKPFRLREDDFAGYQVQAHQREGHYWATLVGEVDGGELREWVIRELDEGLKLDWAASVGMGDVPFDRLRELPAGAVVAMRVVAGRSNFHTSTYPEDEWACFQLRDGANRRLIWGYAPVGSEIEAGIASAMRENSLLLDRLPEVALILKLSNPGRGARGQFEIVEVVRVGWIEDLSEQ